MANFFDQFDAAQPTASSGNFFDQFDAPARPAYGASGARRVYIDGANAPQQVAEPGLSDTLADVGKSIVSKGAQGLIGLAGMPSDIAELGARGLDYATRGIGGALGYDIAPREAQQPLLGSEQIKNAVEKVTGDFYEPQTTAGKYAGSVAEMLPAIAGGPESLAARFVTRAAVPGLASEAAGQAAHGTALEPAARIAAAIAGGLGAAKAIAPRAVAAPTAEELTTSASALYKHPEVAALELHPSSTAYTASKIAADLNKSGFRQLNTPQTYGIVQELRSPTGQTAKIADIQSVRTALGKVAGNFSNPVEQAAASKAINGIDSYLANLKPYDVAAGDAKRAASILNEAKGNYAAAKRVQRVDDAEYRAELNAASAHSGGNINNATRQALKSILISPAKRRGFSAEELAQMEKVVKGTATGNTMRAVGKLLATSGMHGGGVIGVSAALAPLTHGLSLAVPVAGFAAKKIGERSTANAIKQLDRMTAMRSPLAQSLPALAPSTDPRISGLLSGLTQLRSRGALSPSQ